MREGKYIIKRSKDNQYYFTLVAPNGRVVLTSELYHNLTDCQNGIISVMHNAKKENFNLSDEDKNYRFNLEAINGKIIGISEGYKTKQGRDHGIECVIKYARTERVRQKLS